MIGEPRFRAMERDAGEYGARRAEPAVIVPAGWAAQPAMLDGPQARVPGGLLRMHGDQRRPRTGHGG